MLMLFWYSVRQFKFCSAECRGTLNYPLDYLCTEFKEKVFWGLFARSTCIFDVWYKQFIFDPISSWCFRSTISCLPGICWMMLASSMVSLSCPAARSGSRGSWPSITTKEGPPTGLSLGCFTHSLREDELSFIYGQFSFLLLSKRLAS